jgi:myo-inositol-1(or 4)-monophosphatase
MTLSRDLLAVAEDLARAAGDMALRGRKSGDVAATTKSSPTDMVTQYDKASEELITSGLTARRPHDGIIGEEGASVSGSSGITWHIDPIDGTSNFYFDIPMWAVSIGAVDDSGPLVGVVYAPALGEMYTAIRGEGAFLNGSPIHVRNNSELSDALVCTGFSYRVHERTQHAQRVAQMVTHIRDIRRFGAAAIDLCFVACGRYDAYFEEHLHSWDLIAGQVIATEAGAIVTNYAGESVTPAQVLAAQPGIQQQLVQLIAHSS